MSLAVAQCLEQMIYGMKERPGITLHALDRVAMQRRERPLTISTQQLADPNDHI